MAGRSDNAALAGGSSPSSLERMRPARYDAIADFYEQGWPDTYDDPVSTALLAGAGALDGRRVLDVACGHGRMTRELARRGGSVLGVDISEVLVAKARAAEDADPLGIAYLVADVCESLTALDDASFDVAVCSFGLSDIDGLDPALRTVARALRPHGRFVFSILHPCFPGAGEASGSWPEAGSYYDEGWWSAQGELSSLRRQVGAQHRTLSTYVNALGRHGLRVAEVQEPRPPADWAVGRVDAARYPVFLVVSCIRDDEFAA